LKKVVRFKFSKCVSYWNHDKGNGFRVDGSVDSTHWFSSTSYETIEFTIDEEMTFQKAIYQALEKNNIDDMTFTIFEDGRLTGNRIEDGEGNPLSFEEQTNYDKQTYLCDYSIYIEVLTIVEPSIHKLMDMFPQLELY
jgi:hypothetical protein